MAPTPMNCLWWLLTLRGLIALFVVTALVASLIAIGKSIPAAGGGAVVPTSSLVYDYGLVSVLSVDNPPVFQPQGAGNDMVSGTYYPMRLLIPQVVESRSITSNTAKFNVDGSISPETALIYTPNFAASPTGRVAVSGTIAIDGYIISIGNLLVMLRFGAALSIDLPFLSNPAVMNEMLIRLDTPDAELTFSGTIPFSFNAVAADIPGGSIAIFPVLMVTVPQTKFGTHSVTINVQEVPYTFKAVT